MRTGPCVLAAVLLLACGGETVHTGDRAVGGGGTSPAGSGGATSSGGPSGASGAGVPGVGQGGITAGGGASGSSGVGSGGFGSLDAFYADLQGVWLIGWSGGLNHYSWMQFTVDDALLGAGKVRILDPDDVPSNTPFWSCEGEGSWSLAARPNTIAVSFPAGCSPAVVALTFGPPQKTSFPRASFQTSVEINADPAWPNIEGFKMDGSQCDADFTACEGPF